MLSIEEDEDRTRPRNHKLSAKSRGPLRRLVEIISLQYCFRQLAIGWLGYVKCKSWGSDMGNIASYSVSEQ